MNDMGNDSRIDWETVKLVVFDVDGTLYDQGRLRLIMMMVLLRQLICTRRTHFLRVLRAYRRIREKIGDEELVQFEPVLLARTARVAGCPESFVVETVSEWIEQRPLVYLRQCIYQGVSTLLAALRRRGISIGIFSDYPAIAKLDALGLCADYVVSSVDADVQRLKPHPQGLRVLLGRACLPTSAGLMIGDRIDRDGQAAQRANVRVLIRTSSPVAGWTCFSRYDDPVFRGIFHD